MKTLGDFYYDRADSERGSGDLAAMIADAKTGITYFERFLAYEPTNADARNDMATLFFYSGDTDRALQEVASILEGNPKNVAANLNLGTFYLFGRRDLDAAQKQLTHVVELTKNDTTQRPAYDLAREMLASIAAEESTETSSTATDK